MNLAKLKESGEAPEFLTEEGLITLSKGYLHPGETPKGMYTRISQASASRLNRPDLAPRFFEIMYKGWLCPATPVCSNMGSNKGLPISCYSVHVGDSLDSILMKNHEVGILSKLGGGIGVYLGDLRTAGSQVKGTGGISDGVIAWSKIYDATIHSVSQGSTRRGSAAVYLPVEHGDIKDFLHLRKTTGDINRRCMNLNSGVCITDDFMNRAISGDKEARATWADLLVERRSAGEPYITFIDTVQRLDPDCYKDKGLKTVTSNLCNEITLHTDPDHTFVCCLSSMNLTKWDEWKDTDAVELAIWFLDGVMEEFIQKAKNIHGFESAVRFATKSRALGLGILGWHSLLQKKMIPFDSFDAMALNALVFRTLNTKSKKASRDLAVAYGEPEWCKGYGIRNTHTNAVAPTASNSTISGGVSPGIEPIAANLFVQNSAKGTFIRYNNDLKDLLSSKNLDTPETWAQINKDAGSIFDIKGLSDFEKSVFLTAKEINQHAIVKQAGQRQKWIDQGQSVNLFFGVNASEKYIHEVHLSAWQQGLKGLYYFRSESVLRADLASRTMEECAACEA